MLHTKDWSEQTAKTGIYQLWKLISQSSGGDFREHWIPTLLQRLDGIAASRPKTHLVSAARKRETRIKDFSDEYGYHETEANPVINKLAQYSNPDYGNFKDKAKFEKIQEFVRGVMNDNSIRIEIPASKNTINVEQHGRFLPIEALGTGVFQAILLAAEATIHENAVVCIEEPELHLHPEVQRQVMTYLATETSNQYFISTHSAHIMDAVVDSCVIGVHIEDRWSVVHHPINSQQKRNICHRLGYRPSDLLQANCLIWIEGPSDRIYINHWLRAHDPKLVEGLHYSFSLYGGRVLSNFTSDEDAEDDLIEILPVNRFPAIVMDSDRKAVTDGINSTKGRIKVEVEKIGGLVWITDGREIENYVPWKMRDAAIKNTHKVKSLEKSEAEESKFDPPLNYFDHKDVFKDDGFNKNRIALSVTANAADLSVLDLADRIKELVEFINRANRLS